MNEVYVIVWFDPHGLRLRTYTDPLSNYRPVAAALDDISPTPSAHEVITDPDRLEEFLTQRPPNQPRAIQYSLAAQRLGWDITVHGPAT